MEKVLVAGGAGFLGSHLCDRLIDTGNEVWCIDNLITGSKKNINHLLVNPNFHFIISSIIEKLPVLPKITQIYHLASPASPNTHSPKSYHHLPFETMLANTTGTWNLAEFALKRHAKMLFASTSEVYGDPLEHPQKEIYRGNVSTTGPRSVYDESKRFGETILATFIRSRGLDGRIVRIFNTYGPRMAIDDGRALNEFLVAAIANKPITVFGKGLQTRSFCYVSDLVGGLISAMTNSETKGEIFNLGNPEEHTVLELANIIKRLSNSKSKIIFSGKLPEDDPLKRRPDISKVIHKLSWTPTISLKNGLKMMIKAHH